LKEKNAMEQWTQECLNLYRKEINDTDVKELTPHILRILRLLPTRGKHRVSVIESRGLYGKVMVGWDLYSGKPIIKAELNGVEKKLTPGDMEWGFRIILKNFEEARIRGVGETTLYL